MDKFVRVGHSERVDNYLVAVRAHSTGRHVLLDDRHCVSGVYQNARRRSSYLRRVERPQVKLEFEQN